VTDDGKPRLTAHVQAEALWRIAREMKRANDRDALLPDSRDLIRRALSLAEATGVARAWKRDPGNPCLIDELMSVGGHVGDADGRCTSCGRGVDADGIHWH
jgi:hypothetical protein